MNVAIYNAIISIQRLLQSHLERSLSREPFILQDAVGRLSPVHLQFIYSWEAFEDVLERRFHDFQGYHKMKEKAYVFQELATQRDVSRTLPWHSVFLPGERIGMDIVSRKQNCDEGDNTSCPKCREPAVSSLGCNIQWSV